MHGRTPIIDAIEAALAEQMTLIQATDAVQETDVPCVVVEEREETGADFDRILERHATRLRRRLRFAVFAFGRTKRERDDLAEAIETLVVPAVLALDPIMEAIVKCGLVGVGFSRSRLGTKAAAFVAAQFYDAEYFTPTYM